MVGGNAVPIALIKIIKLCHPDRLSAAEGAEGSLISDKYRF